MIQGIQYQKKTAKIKCQDEISSVNFDAKEYSGIEYTQLRDENDIEANKITQRKTKNTL